MSKTFFKRAVRWTACAVGIGALAVGSLALAGPTESGIALSALSKNVQSSVSNLSVVVGDISLTCGIIFVMIAFFKFHAHKQNPQQTQMSQPITFLLLGAGLLLFPTMLPTAKRAVFGTQAKISTVNGSQLNSIIGANSTAGGG